jgi:phenylpyruvate tautomerase PptA (4-oxalocrotonate tautomerase family)
MPLVRIEILEGRSVEERRQLFEAIHEALVEAFEIPDDDRIQRIVEHERANFAMPPGSSDRYTLIEITAFPGRSRTAKAVLYESIVRRLRELEIGTNDVSIVVHEPPMENWGVRGGRPADEVDLGYRLDL